MSNAEGPGLTVNDVPLKWHPGGHGFTFAGLESVLFWLKPSLASCLLPLREEIGEDLYASLIAFESSKNTGDDYSSMISTAPDFEAGFAGWTRAVSAAGWGMMTLEKIDWKTKTATVSIVNPWETRISRAHAGQNEIPFINGKISGIFSHAFRTNCRAEIAEVRNDGALVMMEIAPSKTTLEETLLELHEAKAASSDGNLRAVNNALRRNTRRLLDVMATVGEFIWETDRHLNFTHVTGPSFDALGVDESALLGNGIDKFLAPAEFQRFLSILRPLSRGQQFVEGEFKTVRPNGNEVVILIRAKCVLDFNGHHIGYMGSGRDVTDQKKLRDLLQEQQRSAEYASKMATLGEMAGGIAHEINTPLAVISMLSEQALMTVPEDSPIRLMATTILETTDRIGKIITGLKAFARDGSAEDAVEIEVDRVIRDTLTLCQSRFDTHGIELRVKNETPELVVNARPTQLSQVLLNLLNNAFDAVHALPERWAEISVKPAGKTILIRVTDSGRGIPVDVREKIMNPFFTTKAVGHGTGLGLSISKGLIEAHGGRLYYKDDGAHTSFVIELPMS